MQSGIENRDGRLRVAFLGSRGIPSCYSGFETFYENIATRLASRGHEVTVYNRRHFHPSSRGWYRGVRLITLPTIRTKHMETLVHTFLSVLHASTQSYDVVYVCTVGNSPMCGLARLLTRSTVVLNVDGNDWDREKWTPLARWYIRTSMRLASLFSHQIVVDSEVMRSVVHTHPNCDVSYLPYGASVGRSANLEALKAFGLEPDGYILFVGRIVPENGPHDLIRAFQMVRTDKKLVVVGDAPYMDRYKRDLSRLAELDSRVMLTGYQFGEAYRSLSSHAYLFALPSRIQGTRPVLLDQMGFGNCVLVPDSSANVETIGDAGETYPAAGGPEELARRIETLIAAPKRVQEHRVRAVLWIRRRYEWETVTDQYEAFLREVAQRSNGHRLDVGPTTDVEDSATPCPRSQRSHPEDGASKVSARTCNL